MYIIIFSLFNIIELLVVVYAKYCFARYEMHYNTLHRYVCSSCHRCFPTQHLLDLHLIEWHDAMFELQSASQKMVSSVKCTET